MENRFTCRFAFLILITMAMMGCTRDAASGRCVMLPDMLVFLQSGPVTNPACYAKLRARMHDPDGNFPPAIPEDATDIRFSYEPQFMQGAGHLYLAVRLDPERIEEIGARAAEEALFIYGGDELRRRLSAHDPFLQVAVERLYTTEAPLIDDVTGNTTVYLYAESGRDRCQRLDGGQLFCNHFGARGITVIPETLQVTFWYFLM